jgi:hypothetical protein
MAQALEAYVDEANKGSNG